MTVRLAKWVATTAILLIVFTAIHLPANASDVTTSDPQEANSLDVRMLELISDELSEYRRHLEVERAALFSFLRTIISGVSILVGVGAGVFLWLMGRQLKSAIEVVRQEFQLQAEAKMDQLVHSQLGDVRRRISTLTEMVERQLSYRESHILFLTHTAEQLNEFQADEIASLEECGLSVESAVFSKSEWKRHLRQKEPDLLIYTYEPDPSSERDPNLLTLLEQLRDREARVPVVIYTRNFRTSDEESEALHAYRMGTYANTPLTLIREVYLLAHAYAPIGN